jgi:hypothetical protein
MRRRPLSGALIGILVGVAVAVVLARIGVWPLDQLTVFLLPALVGTIGMTVLSIGRENSLPTMVVALIILVPMLVWGVLGFADINENGQLNGGCTVTADSKNDSTTVTDTSRSDPFVLLTDGSLSWNAVSPEVFRDYDWQLDVVVGGLAVPVQSGTEANRAGDTENRGSLTDVGEYVADRGIDLDIYRGLYEVGGSAATCDGFGFLQIEGEGSDMILIAAIVSILLLVILYGALFTEPGATGYESQENEDGDNIDITEALRPYGAGSEDPNEGLDQG